MLFRGLSFSAIFGQTADMILVFDAQGGLAWRLSGLVYR